MCELVWGELGTFVKKTCIRRKHPLYATWSLQMVGVMVPYLPRVMVAVCLLLMGMGLQSSVFLRVYLLMFVSVSSVCDEHAQAQALAGLWAPRPRSLHPCSRHACRAS